MEMTLPSATYSKYDELLEVKVAAIVVLLELCIRFFASMLVWKLSFLTSTVCRIGIIPWNGVSI